MSVHCARWRLLAIVGLYATGTLTGCASPGSVRPYPPTATAPLVKLPPPPPTVFGIQDSMFGFNRADLTNTVKANLRKRVADFEVRGSTIVLITRGYADGVGKHEPNMNLSKMRARNVQQYLTDRFTRGGATIQEPSTVIACGKSGAAPDLDKHGSLTGKRVWAREGIRDHKRRVVIATIVDKDTAVDDPSLTKEARTC